MDPDIAQGISCATNPDCTKNKTKASMPQPLWAYDSYQLSLECPLKAYNPDKISLMLLEQQGHL
jgi:hypothetical protein